MIPFSLEMPRAVHFGRGTLRKLPETVREIGARVMILSGGGWLRGAPWDAEIEKGLEGCAVRRFFCPPAEPSVRSVDAAAAAAAGFTPDVLVAVGGGSVMDTAKALSALVRFPGSAERFLEGLPGSAPVPGPCLPWIAVPDDVGHGSGSHEERRHQVRGGTGEAEHALPPPAGPRRARRPRAHAFASRRQ